MEFLPVAVWLVVFGVLSAIALPIAVVLFGRLPGSGAGFSPTIAWGVIGLVAYWVGTVRFGLVALWAGLLVLAVGASLAYRRYENLPLQPFGEAMLVFTATFLFQVAIRAVDPGILPHLEDFLDYGMMRAILRASYLPPEDFWFAGVRVRYHYGGHLVAALATTLTGVRSSIGYNLALAGFYAMLLTGAYELARAIAGVAGKQGRVAGVFAVYFVGFAGNLLLPVVVLVRALPDPITSIVVPRLASDLGGPPSEFLRRGFEEFQYWDILQTIPGTLTPFPLFSWLHGELHAHMNSAPFFLFTVGIFFAYYVTPEWARFERRLLALVAAPLAIGFTAFTDVLTFPSLLGMLCLTVYFAPTNPVSLFPERTRTNRLRGYLRPWWREYVESHWFWSELGRLGVAVIVTVVVTVVVIVTSPFLRTVLGGGRGGVGFVPEAVRSDIWALLVVHGIFVSVFAVYLSRRIRGELRRDTSSALRVALVITGVTALAVVLDAPALLIPGLLLIGGWYVLWNREQDFEILLIVGAAGVVVLAEFIYFVNQEYVIDGRGNTVFRLYWHAWLLWGVAAGVVVPRILTLPNASQLRHLNRATVTTVFVVCIFLSSAVYGGYSVSSHFDRAFDEPAEPWEQAEYVYEATRMQDSAIPPTQPPTIDGLLYAQVKHPNESVAIEWLDDYVDGNPTMVTAPGGRWEWRSAPAALTGLPTVAGWAHELVYRDWQSYYERVDDVRTLYSGGPDRRIELLERYDVKYVYVGPDERHRYDVWEFSILDGVSAVYLTPEVAIYEVDQSALGYSPAPGTSTQYASAEFGINQSVANRGTQGMNVINEGRSETLVWWGPYATMSPGEYVATFHVRVTPTGTAVNGSSAVLEVDVARGALRNGTADFRVLGSARVEETNGVQAVSVPFTLTQPAADVEFRGHLGNRSGTIQIQNVTVTEVSRQPSEDDQ